LDLFSPSLSAAVPKSKGIFLIGLTAAIALLYFGKTFFVTLVVAVILAFILDPLVVLLMRIRLPRGVASFLTCSFALLLLYLAALAFYGQAAGLVEDLPTYSQRINELVDSVIERLENAEKSMYQVIVPKRIRDRDQPPEPTPAAKKAPPVRRRSAEPPEPPPVQEVRIRQERPPIINSVYTYLSGFYDALLMASFVPFLVYFMLSWRDHMRISFLSLFDGASRMIAGKSWEGIADMVRAYVVGNFFLGLLLAGASSAAFWLFNLPYPLLIGPSSGFLSLIPYIGLPLALIPPFFSALPIYNSVSAYLVIGSVVAFFHLLALNLLYPKLVGSRVHLNPLAVTLALMFWGTIWGGVGLVLGIPITAGLKAVCDNVRELEAYGKLLGD